MIPKKTLKRKWFSHREKQLIFICYDTEWKKEPYTNIIAIVYPGRQVNAGKTMVRDGADRNKYRVWSESPYKCCSQFAADEILDHLRRGQEIQWESL